MKLAHAIRTAIGGFTRSQSGAIAPIIALAATALVAASGYAIDMGHLMWVQRQLQASSDAAALAGATYVATSTSNATTAANSYSGLSGQKNAVLGASSVSMVGGAPAIECLANAIPSCGHTTSGRNVVVVTQTATVPTYFLKVLGINSFTARATATASAKGGPGEAQNVMVVLDTTQSMTNTDSHCAGFVPDPNHPLSTDPKHFLSQPTKVQCAQVSAYLLLKGLSPGNQVGFMTFPPVDTSGKNDDTTCPNSGGKLGSGDVLPYGSTTTTTTGKGNNKTTTTTSTTAGASAYTLVDLGGGFSSGGNLVSNNPGVILAGGGGSNCKGLQAAGGVGTYYADALQYAQAALPSAGNAQNVIILLSDGDASSGDVSSAQASNQCQHGISNAMDATAANTVVYTVGYGMSSSGCSTDTSNYGGTHLISKKGLTPCTAMSMMASSSGAEGTYYSDGSGGSNCPTSISFTSLPDAFSDIVGDLTKPRLIPNNTQ